MTKNNLSIEEFLESYPYLDPSDVHDALNYCSGLRCLDDRPQSYCQSCMLDHRKEEEPSFFITSAEKLRMYLKNGKDEGQAYLGSRQDYEDEVLEKVWELAEKYKLASNHDI